MTGSIRKKANLLSNEACRITAWGRVRFLFSCEKIYNPEGILYHGWGIRNSQAAAEVMGAA